MVGRPDGNSVICLVSTTRGSQRLFQQRRDDPQFLDALNEELKRRDSDEAFDLHIEVVKARRAFARAAMPRVAAVRPPQSEPGSQLAARLSGRGEA